MNRVASPARLAALAAVESVSVVYGRGDAAVHALRDVSAELRTRDRVALWGRSGSGKTTLLHVLGGLVVPSAGTVRWLGEELRSLDAAARASDSPRTIAYVFQGANLLPHFTAFENVAFAALPMGRPASQEPDQLLELVGLGSKLDSLPAELSGGEAQRVALARALAQGPVLRLCDEPTGHLDSDTGQRVLDLIDALQAELGFALVIATHDAEVAARMDRTISLHDGRVVDG
jgi:ABC-type lipoprotein export system ATPase subunit